LAYPSRNQLQMVGTALVRGKRLNQAAPFREGIFPDCPQRRPVRTKDGRGTELLSGKKMQSQSPARGIDQVEAGIRVLQVRPQVSGDPVFGGLREECIQTVRNEDTVTQQAEDARQLQAGQEWRKLGLGIHFTQSRVVQPPTATATPQACRSPLPYTV
jgi:hypothetical protein